MLEIFIANRIVSYIRNVKEDLERKLGREAFKDTTLEHANKLAIDYLDGMRGFSLFHNISFRDLLNHGGPTCFPKSVYTYAAFLNACEITESVELMEEVQLVFGGAYNPPNKKRCAHAYLRQNGLVFEAVPNNRGFLHDYLDITSLSITKDDTVFYCPWKLDDSSKPLITNLKGAVFRQIPVQYLF